ncbi:hypothetical protein DFP72DRAFT_364369 [Ephemerocybe angulata]|uniref:DRBM domain-containing protein n=1 Tax=Ephemerocybe angulata TaxID=980116 RepID=A0A8H6HX23_9AGAR|nr:hypothetical protein DFP72DRAFT_364369 [Tulosesus angulatus]
MAASSPPPQPGQSTEFLAGASQFSVNQLDQRTAGRNIIQYHGPVNIIYYRSPPVSSPTTPGDRDEYMRAGGESKTPLESDLKQQDDSESQALEGALLRLSLNADGVTAAAGDPESGGASIDGGSPRVSPRRGSSAPTIKTTSISNQPSATVLFASMPEIGDNTTWRTDLNSSAIGVKVDGMGPQTDLSASTSEGSPVGARSLARTQSIGNSLLQMKDPIVMNDAPMSPAPAASRNSGREITVGMDQARVLAAVIPDTSAPSPPGPILAEGPVPGRKPTSWEGSVGKLQTSNLDEPVGTTPSSSSSPEASSVSTSRKSTLGRNNSYTDILNSLIKDESPWRLISSTGPDHQRVHTMSLVIAEVEKGRTSATTKKQAKNMLAYAYLREKGYVQIDPELDGDVNSQENGDAFESNVQVSNTTELVDNVETYAAGNGSLKAKSVSLNPESSSLETSSYVQILDVYTKGGSSWRYVSSTGREHQPIHTVALFVRGVEKGRASGSTKKHAKDVLAYVYLREEGHVQRKQGLDTAATIANATLVNAEPRLDLTPRCSAPDERLQKPQYMSALQSRLEEPAVWELVSSAGPSHKPIHTMRFLVRGVEQGRASADSKNLAKKIAAYRYLREKGCVETDSQMDALCTS